MAPFLRSTTTGEKALLGRLRGMPRAFLGEMAQAVPREAEALMQAAQATAPSKSGALRASAVVTHQVKRSRVQAAAAYTAKYAAAVHEGMHWGVKGQHPGMKWYEKALNAFAPGFALRMADALRRVLGR